MSDAFNRNHCSTQRTERTFHFAETHKVIFARTRTHTLPLTGLNMYEYSAESHTAA